MDPEGVTVVGCELAVLDMALETTPGELVTEGATVLDGAIVVETATELIVLETAVELIIVERDIMLEDMDMEDIMVDAGMAGVVAIPAPVVTDPCECTRAAPHTATRRSQLKAAIFAVCRAS